MAAAVTGLLGSVKWTAAAISADNKACSESSLPRTRGNDRRSCPGGGVKVSARGVFYSLVLIPTGLFFVCVGDLTVSGQPGQGDPHRVPGGALQQGGLR